jgi:hypothetical protein
LLAECAVTRRLTGERGRDRLVGLRLLVEPRQRLGVVAALEPLLQRRKFDRRLRHGGRYGH